MPVPKIVPMRVGSYGKEPDCSIASFAAASAYCSHRSARRTSFGPSKYGAGSHSETSTVTLPVVPGPNSPFQKFCLPIPHGATTPYPVIATRWPAPCITISAVAVLRDFCSHKIEGLADSVDAFEIAFRH